MRQTSGGRLYKLEKLLQIDVSAGDDGDDWTLASLTRQGGRER